MKHIASTFALILILLALRTPAGAVPIFAQRYGFSCSACHTAVPDLNPFGDAFRQRGFQLPNAPRHREFPVALRFQETYVKDLTAAQSRRFNALGVLISTANFGHVGEYSYFARYLLGSEGAAGSLYYAWTQHVQPSSGSFQRIGLFGLPLIANPTQRLDTITAQNAYTYQVGHNSANFATPRLGALFGRRNERQDVELAISFDEYHGAAYGAPAPPSEFAQSFAQPELFASALFTTGGGVKIGVLGLTGARAFRSRVSGASFRDEYSRQGIDAAWSAGRFDVRAQQLWGRDANSDGSGDAVASSGGFITAKYHMTKHSYAGVRYDAAANPLAARDFDFYAVVPATVHSRFVVEYLRPLGFSRTQPVFSSQLLFAVPFEKPPRL
ncbi:MAG: hypothetical protein GIW99_02640 [Candidatus Eremiobacteraeota bacterium]|nr:hypothetical protein [Candidatus Eremiobacteraeota bacterium]MBC5826572.1 hypothetical protein [Candidatus Eremiobacteraeota bacterium]